MSSVCCNVLAKLIRLGCLVVFFAVVISSLPVHLKYDGANAQSSGRLRTQGPPSRNLPYFTDARGVELETPKAMPKEYGRSELSPTLAQSVSTLYPGANQTPDPGQGGTLAVTGILNDRHGSTGTGAGVSPPPNSNQSDSRPDRLGGVRFNREDHS